MGGLPQRKGAAFTRSKRRSRGSLLGDRIVIWTSLVSDRRFVDRRSTLQPQPVLEGLAFQQLHGNKWLAILLADVMMVQMFG